MSFSSELIEQCKKTLKLSKDSEVLEVVPIGKTVLSEVKSGKRHLTEEQALAIASACELNPEWVLVNLAAETSKSESGKSIWAKLAKKLSSHGAAFSLILVCLLGSVPDSGKVVLLEPLEKYSYNYKIMFKINGLAYFCFMFLVWFAYVFREQEKHQRKERHFQELIFESVSN